MAVFSNGTNNGNAGGLGKVFRKRQFFTIQFPIAQGVTK
jgi:hypothetical protein